MPGIDQLIYTWSEVRLYGRPGYGVCAASQGLSDERSARYQKLSPYVSYDLPPRVNANTMTSDNAPICLALMTIGSEHVLLRKQYAGIDAAGRPGIYLTHLLAGLPPTVSAREAILLWYARESDLWITDWDVRRPPSLPPVPSERLYELQQQAQNKFSLPESLQSAFRESLMLFLHNSLPKRIYLAGESEAIATIIWGITQSLPRDMLRGMTFNTYEDKVQSSKETIVGLSPYQGVPRLGTGEAYIDLNSAAQPFLIEPTSTMVTYIDFVIEQLSMRSNLALGSSDGLDQFVTVAEMQEINTLGALLALFEATHPLPPLPPASGSPEPSEPPIPPAPSLDKKPRKTAYRHFRAELSQAPRLRVTLLFLSLCLIALLIYIPFGQNASSESTLTQITQTAQQQATQTSIALSDSSGVQLHLVGAYVTPNPVKNNTSLMLYVIVQNIGHSSWSVQQDYYLVCVPQNGQLTDSDCQAIANSRTFSEPEQPDVQMQGIGMMEGALVAPQGYYVFVFSLTARFTQGNPPGGKDTDNHTINVQIFHNGQNPALLSPSYTISFTVKKA